MTLKTKTNLFYSFIIVSFVISVFFTYERAFITKDFEITQEEQTEDIEENTVSDSIPEEMEGFEVSSTSTQPTSSQ